MRRWRFLAVAHAAIGMTFLAGGCVSQKSGKPVAAEKVFIPSPPAPPRLQFLASFRGADDWIGKAQKKSSFGEFIAGEEKSAMTSTSFASPYGIAAHNGKVYVCDIGSDRVHVIDMAAKKYSTLEAPVKIENPVNIAIDDGGKKYVCDSVRRSVLVFDASDRFVGEIGDPKTCVPLDVAVHGSELYIADVTGGEIEVWSTDGELIRMISSKGMAPDQLDQPTNLEIAGDLIFVTDTMQQTVKVFTLDGVFQNIIGKAGGSLGSFARPKGVAVDDEMHVYVADAQFDAVQIFQKSGQLLMTFGAPGDKPESMGMPAGLCIDSTSIAQFQSYLDSNFKPEYLLFVVNQFGLNKVAVYAYGRSTQFTAAEYEVKPLPASQPAATLPATTQPSP